MTRNHLLNRAIPAELCLQPDILVTLPKSPPKIVGNDLDSMAPEISFDLDPMKKKASGPAKPTIKEWFDLIEANEKSKRRLHNEMLHKGMHPTALYQR